MGIDKVDERQGLLDRLGALIQPIHRDGHVIIGLAFLATLVLFALWSPLGWLGALATLVIAYTFRDPDRVVPQGAGLVVAPADGRVEAIERLAPPSDLGLAAERCLRISIAISLADVHITRAPVSGTIERIRHRVGGVGGPGREEAEEEKEHRIFVIRTSPPQGVEPQDGEAQSAAPDSSEARAAHKSDGNGSQEVAVVQIASRLFRRVVAFVEEGERVGVGARIGIIRLGSRVDLYLPAEVTPLVAVGQTMIAGETVIADANLAAAERSARVV